MYWRHKGEFQINTRQRRDNLIATVSDYLATKATTAKSITPTDEGGRFWMTIIVNYVNQVDADQVWNDVQSARTPGFIVQGWMGYAAMNDDGTSTLLGRFDIP
jgi:hypothetical protein